MILFLGSREGTLGRCAVSASSLGAAGVTGPGFHVAVTLSSVICLAIGQFELCRPFPSAGMLPPFPASLLLAGMGAARAV